MSDDRYFITAPLHRPIRMGALGMDQRQRNALRLLFNNKCLNRYILVEDGIAQIYILDLDVFGGERLWDEFRKRHPRRPLIILSLNPREAVDPYTLFVRKPIVVTSLIEAIEQQRCSLSELEERSLAASPVATAPPQSGLDKSTETPPKIPAKTPSSRVKPAAHKAASLMSESAEQAFVGTSPDIDPTDREQLSKIHYDPALYLQGHFLKALDYAERHKRNLAIEGPWPTIHIFFDQDTVTVNAKERQLRPYCTLPDATRKIRLRPLGDLAFPADDAPAYRCSVTAFLWQLSLWASRGRLPEGTDIFQPIHLRRWPNFTRLAVTPHALAITALWAHEPHSLIDTATTLNIPQRYVFAFYSAANALQLVEGETAHGTRAPFPRRPVNLSKNRGTLGRLLGYLKGQMSNPAPSSEPRWQ